MWTDEKVEYQLRYPVLWGKDSNFQVDKLEFRCPTTGDIMDLGVSPKMSDMIEIAGKCVDHEGGSQLIKKLHPSDGVKVAELMGNFLGDGLETGE